MKRNEIQGGIILVTFLLVAVIVLSQLLTLLDYIFGA
jgi:hypothetical protein